jgi:transposase
MFQGEANFGIIISMEAVADIAENSLLEENERLRRTVEERDKTIRLLQEKIQYLLNQRFGPKSERLDDRQQSLFDAEAPPEAPEDPEEIRVPEHTRRKGGRRRPPEHLPRERIEHDLPEEEKRCTCGACLTRIGEETSERYDVIPPKFRIEEHVRFVYACPVCDAAPKTAEHHPSPPLPRTQASAGILAWIGTSKYVDALALNRVAGIMTQRFGVPFTTTTLADWMIKAEAWLLAPLLAAIDAALVRVDYLHMDETTFRVLLEPGRTAEQKSWLWECVSGAGPPIVRMYYSPSRAGAVVTELLDGFSGYLQTDGYVAYDAAAARLEIVQVGCWAHARRKFDAAMKNSPPAAAQVARQALVLIGELYDIDKRANDKPLDERHVHRQQHVAPHVDRMRAWLEAHAAFGLGHGGLLTTAFTYLYNQWEKLVRFLEDPRLRLDNNLAERHIRPVALGRRTWLFCRSQAGARASAGWYSVVETAKANGLEPYWYLRYVFEQMPLYLKEGRSVEPLLPWNLSAEQIVPSADRG